MVGLDWNHVLIAINGYESASCKLASSSNGVVKIETTDFISLLPAQGVGYSMLRTHIAFFYTYV